MATHLYTASMSEKQSAISGGFNDEGVACYVYNAPAVGPAPLFRAYHPQTGAHLYTMDFGERNNAINNLGWTAEGIACYIYNQRQAGTVPLYRAHLPAVDDYFYTTNLTEHNNAVQQSGYSDEGITGYVLLGQISGTAPLYRMFNGREHLYTDDPNEHQNAVQSLGFKDEGISCYVYSAPVPGPEPLYRAFQPRTGGHLYTLDLAEYNHAVNNLGWTAEGIACYAWRSAESGTVPLYRTYCPPTDDHFYTTDASERARVIQQGFNDEGIAGYVMANGGTGLTAFARLYGPFIRGRVPNFLPSTCGLHFSNGGYPPGTTYPIVTLPVIGTLVSGDAANGLCGGFAYTVLDLFMSNPRLQPPPNTDANKPAPGSALFNYIVGRLVDSFGSAPGYDNAAKAIEWTQTSSHERDIEIPGLPFVGRGLAYRMVNDEWPAVKADIDSGRPSPLMLVMAPQCGPLDIVGISVALRRSHQVLAYAYLFDPTSKDLSLWLYDCNDPNDDTSILTLNTSDPDHTINISAPTLEAHLAEPAPIRGFFRSDYSYHNPAAAAAATIGDPFSKKTTITSETSPTTPFMASLSGRLYIAWKGADNRLNVMYSADNGANFGNKFTSGEGSSQAPALCAHNGKLYIAWTGVTNNNLNVAIVEISGDNITGFSNKVTLRDTSPLSPSLASFGGQLYIAWKGADNNLNVMYSADNGATFGNKYTSPETSPQAPGLTASGNNVFIAWEGIGNDYLNVAAVNILGQSITGFSKMTLGDTSPLSPALAQLDGHLYLSWKGSCNNQLNVEHSTDSGHTFGNKVTSSELSPQAPSLCVHNGTVYIAWTGEGNEYLNVAQVGA